MNRDVGSNDFTTASLGYFRVRSDKVASSTSFRQGNNDILLLFKHRSSLGFLALDDNGDLVFDGLAVGWQVV